MVTSNEERVPSRPFGFRELEVIVRAGGEGEKTVCAQVVRGLIQVGGNCASCKHSHLMGRSP
jgi:hypothetical protein